MTLMTTKTTMLTNNDERFKRSEAATLLLLNSYLYLAMDKASHLADSICKLLLRYVVTDVKPVLT
jgi:hypothetical protein